MIFRLTSTQTTKRWSAPTGCNALASQLLLRIRKQRDLDGIDVNRMFDVAIALVDRPRQHDITIEELKRYLGDDVVRCHTVKCTG